MNTKRLNLVNISLITVRLRQTGGHSQVRTDRWTLSGEDRQVDTLRYRQTGGHSGEDRQVDALR